MTDSPWTRRISGLAFWLAIAAVAVALIGTTLARYDVIGKLPGFMSFVYMAMAGGGIAVLALIALVMNWRAGWPAAGKAVTALVIGVAAFGALSLLRSTAADYPFIHDVTTDLDNPPEFAELIVPEDNLRGTEGVEDWKAQHREGYPDIDGILVAMSPAEVVAKAAELAEERGWTIAATAPEKGRFEAVAYASWIKFEDIVVLRAVPADGGRTRVDMRSVSRVGQSDLGENAKRIREFLAALQTG
ncbi:DUF1499 domain-containing protein [Erythrobacter litoralis]|uniref:DUF1499 domain-containing protein n=1 Tax=Erythrobacter litoralis (strain HTCC2594) TaxID=314225 RepID=Q2NAB2_ERYLH|nr:DUF1499 domain-containing protein [Erythrobacter litoralis]ABC63379.1 hypothetical protein ELI_06435 [Erythrobacter litoralis HTCC2594]